MHPHLPVPYVALVTSGDMSESDGRHFPALDPERSDRSRRYRMLAVAGVVLLAAAGALAALMGHKSPKPQRPSPLPSPASVRLPAAARPLPGAADAAAL